MLHNVVRDKKADRFIEQHQVQKPCLVQANGRVCVPVSFHPPPKERPYWQGWAVFRYETSEALPFPSLGFHYRRLVRRPCHAQGFGWKNPLGPLHLSRCLLCRVVPVQMCHQRALLLPLLPSLFLYSRPKDHAADRQRSLGLFIQTVKFEYRLGIRSRFSGWGRRGERCGGSGFLFV